MYNNMDSSENNILTDKERKHINYLNARTKYPHLYKKKSEKTPEEISYKTMYSRLKNRIINMEISGKYTDEEIQAEKARFNKEIEYYKAQHKNSETQEELSKKRREKRKKIFDERREIPISIKLYLDFNKVLLDIQIKNDAILKGLKKYGRYTQEEIDAEREKLNNEVTELKQRIESNPTQEFLEQIIQNMARKKHRPRRNGTLSSMPTQAVIDIHDDNLDSESKTNSHLEDLINFEYPYDDTLSDIDGGKKMKSMKQRRNKKVRKSMKHRN